MGCECSAELYNLVRERAAATGDSMAGVLRTAVVRHLADESDVLSTLSKHNFEVDITDGQATDNLFPPSEATAADQLAAQGTVRSDDLPAVVDAIATLMASAMKSALVEFLMGKPEPLQATCETFGSTTGEALWFMAEFMRHYSDWQPDIE